MGFPILFWGWRSASLELRLYCVFAAVALVASLRDPLLLPGSTPRWEVLARATGIRYWFFPSLMFLWLAASSASGARSTRCGVLDSVFCLHYRWVVRKWTYPPWPESHFSAEVERFKGLNAGQQMTFSVYDPGGRTMELVKK